LDCASEALPLSPVTVIKYSLKQPVGDVVDGNQVPGHRLPLLYGQLPHKHVGIDLGGGFTRQPFDCANQVGAAGFEPEGCKLPSRPGPRAVEKCERPRRKARPFCCLLRSPESERIP